MRAETGLEIKMVKYFCVDSLFLLKRLGLPVDTLSSSAHRLY